MPSSGVQTCALDRKSTRLNSSHTIISYAVFCLTKKKGANTTVVITVTVLAVTVHISPTGALLLRIAGSLRFTATAFYTLFFFNDTATPEIYTLSLHDALPI